MFGTKTKKFVCLLCLLSFASLCCFSNSYKITENQLQQLEQTIENAKISAAQQQRTIETLQKNLKEQSKLLKQYERKALKTKITVGAASFSVGFCVGFGVGAGAFYYLFCTK